MIIILIVLLTTTIGKHSLEATETTEVQRQNNIVKATEQYELLLKHISQKEDYYGGAYINDHGNLVVCVTDKYNKKSNLIQTYTQNTNILLQNVRYSHHMLSQIKTQITQMRNEAFDIYTKASDEFQLITSMCGTSVDAEKNMVVVEISGLDETKIQLFKKIFIDKECIAFEEGVPWTYTDE